MTGVFYGIYHRRTLQKAYDQEKEHRAIHQRQDLIAEAKEAWRKKREGGKDGGECCCCCFAGLNWACVLWTLGLRLADRYNCLCSLSRTHQYRKDIHCVALHFCWDVPRIIWYYIDAFSSTVITDPEDPRFDLEKLIAKWESDS